MYNRMKAIIPSWAFPIDVNLQKYNLKLQEVEHLAA